MAQPETDRQPAPSLPAGINTDDSDPLRDPSRSATLHAYSWPQVTPFSGGSLSSPWIFSIGDMETE